MIALLQRVTAASVEIDGNIVGKIKAGLLVFLAVQKNDNQQSADKMIHRVLTYRVFADSSGKMNRNVQEFGGGVLLVPQFTLAADTKKGLRPNFSSAESPELGKKMFDYFLNKLNAEYDKVSSGKFAADMQVNLTNDGPVTFWLEL